MSDDEIWERRGAIEVCKHCDTVREGTASSTVIHLALCTVYADTRLGRAKWEGMARNMAQKLNEAEGVMDAVSVLLTRLIDIVPHEAMLATNKEAEALAVAIERYNGKGEVESEAAPTVETCRHCGLEWRCPGCDGVREGAKAARAENWGA